jgi:hypothetical protein
MDTRSSKKRPVCALLLIVACAFGCEASDPKGGDPLIPAGDGDGDGDGPDAGESDASVLGDAGPDAGSEAGSGGAGGGASGTGGTAGDPVNEADGGDGDGDQPDAGGARDPDAASDLGAACFEAGDQVAPTGLGACDAPFVIDMRMLELGEAVVHAAGNATTNGLTPSIGKCAVGTARDIVYNVQLPSEADLEVSVDAAEGADPSILVQDGPDAECDKAAATECVDESGAGACEYLRVRASRGAYEDATPQVVIGEIEHSGVPLSVRFRLVDPAGGS